MSPAGYGRHMREMIKAFQNRGHQVSTQIMGGIESSMLSQQSPAPLKSKAFLKVITPPMIWATLRDLKLMYFDKHSFLTLNKIAAETNPDIIYERISYLQASGLKVAKRKNIFHVAEINSPCVEERIALRGKTLLKSKAQEVEKEILVNSDCIVVVSTSLKNYFQKLYDIDDKKIIVLPNAVSLEDVPPYERFTGGKPSNQEELVIGFVGSLFQWHGVDLLIRAFSDCLEEIPNIKLLIVGDGYVRNDLQSLGQSLDIEKHITFTGYVPPSEIYDYISKMDICVMPNSNWYGSPVKLFEYGVMGKAAIAPDNGPVKDFMQDHVHGLLVKPDPSCLKDALIELIRDPDLRNQLGENFRKKILQDHTWLQNVDKVIQKVRLLN